jgi:hypothetical protein
MLRGPCRDYIKEFERTTESREWEYNEVQQSVQEWEGKQLPVGDNHGKLVVEEELEVSLWRLSVWLEDVVTVTFLIPLPGYD